MKNCILWRRIALVAVLTALAPAAIAGTVVIYAVADLQVIRPLISGFEQAHPEGGYWLWMELRHLMIYLANSLNFRPATARHRAMREPGGR